MGFMIIYGGIVMFKFLGTKDRLRKAEHANKELLERIEELTDALIEVAEIVAEEVEDG